MEEHEHHDQGDDEQTENKTQGSAATFHELIREDAARIEALRDAVSPLMGSMIPETFTASLVDAADFAQIADTGAKVAESLLPAWKDSITDPMRDSLLESFKVNESFLRDLMPEPPSLLDAVHASEFLLAEMIEPRPVLPVYDYDLIVPPPRRPSARLNEDDVEWVKSRGASEQDAHAEEDRYQDLPDEGYGGNYL